MLNLIKKAHQFNKRQADHTRATRLILEKNLTGEELSQYVNLYDDWANISIGEYIAELSYIRYEGQLYQCLQGEGHEKQDDITPDDTDSQFELIYLEDIDQEQID